MTTRHSKNITGTTGAIDSSLLGSAYSYYGGVVQTAHSSGKTASGVKRVFAAAMLSGASVLAVGIAGTGNAAAGTCVGPINETYTCAGTFDDTIEYDSGVDDVTLVLGPGSFIDTTENTSEHDHDNAGIVVVGESDMAIVNNGSIFTGDNTTWVETDEEYGYYAYLGDGHHGIAAYSNWDDAAVENTAFGTIVTTSSESHGMVAEALEGSASADNAGLIGTSGEDSHGISATAKYSVDVVNSGTITTDGTYSHGIWAALDSEYGYGSFGGIIEISNSGSIETSGESASGISANAEEGDVEIANSGSIVTEGDEALGIWAHGDDVDVVNTADGSIVTYGADAHGVYIFGDTVSLSNAGTIETYGEDAHAVVAYSGGIDTTTIVNTGLIQATGEEADAIRASGPTVRITNDVIEEDEEVVDYGVIRSEDGAAIHVTEADDARLYNNGAIYGNVSIETDEYGYAVNTGSISSDRKWKAALAIDAEEGDVVVVNDGDIEASGRKAKGVELEGYDVTLTNTGSIETWGSDGHAVDLEGDEEYGEVTLNNSGLIQASGEEADAVRASGETVRITNQAVLVPGETDAYDTTIYGIIRSEDGAAIRVDESDVVYVVNDGFIYSNISIEADDYAYVSNAGSVSSDRRWKAAVSADVEEGNAVIVNDGEIVTTASRAAGIEVDVELGDAYVVNSGTITTGSLEEGEPEGGWRSHGIDVFAEDTVLVLNTGDVTTYGHKAKGIRIETQEGTAAGVNSGTIDTWGEDSTGLIVTATSREHYDGYSYFDISGIALAGNIGSVETRGDDAMGVVAVAEGNFAAALNVLGGSISTSGDDAHGLVAVSGFESVEDALEGSEYSEGGEGSYAIAVNGLPPQLLAGFSGIGTEMGSGVLGEIADVLAEALPEGEYDPADFRSTIVTTGDGAIGVLAVSSNGGAVAGNLYGDVVTGVLHEEGYSVGGDHAYGVAAMSVDEGGAIAFNAYNASIVTNGAYAHGLLAISEDGDAMAMNKYASSIVTNGLGAVGIRVWTDGESDEYSSADALVWNVGSSVTTYGQGAQGIVAFSEEGDVTVANAPMTIGEGEDEEILAGLIETHGDEADGIWASGESDVDVYNSGSIITHGEGANGISASGDEVDIDNSGTIQTSGDEAFGVDMRGWSVSLDNSGTISTSGKYAHAVVGDSYSDLTTTVYNSGTIEATGKYANAVRVSGPTVHVTNTEDGVISSGDVAIYAFETKYASIANHGEVEGSIHVSAYDYEDFASTYIVNTGSVSGDIDTSFGESDDIIIVDGGTVGGAIFTGDGEDEVTISGTGVSIAKGIHGDGEGDLHVLFEQDDTVTFSDGIEGYAISNAHFVGFSSGTTVFDGVNIHTEEGEILVGEDATLATTIENAFAFADETSVLGRLKVVAGSSFGFSGDVVFDEGGTFETGLTGDGAGVVTGDTVRFASGSTIHVDAGAGFTETVGSDFLIASSESESGVTDDGASVTDNLILFKFLKVMNGDVVSEGAADELFLRIEVEETAFDLETEAKGTGNLLSVASALDVYIETQPLDNPLVQYLLQFETEEEQLAALLKVIKDTVPDESNASAGATIASTDLIYDMIMDRLSGGGFVVADGGMTGLSAGDAVLGGDGNWALWGRVGGSKASFTPSGVNGFDADSWGVSLGLDGEVAPALRLGFGGFYIASDVEENGAGANSTNDIAGYGFTTYMSWRPGAWYVNGALGYGMNTYDSRRTSLGSVNTADYDGTQFVARAEAGYMIVSGQWDLTPNVGLRYNRVDIDGYAETGPLPISVNSQTVDSLRAVAGVNARYTMPLDGGGKLIPEFGVKLLGELADPDGAITGQIVGGGVFVTQTTPRDDISYGVGTGITYEASDKFSIRVTYDGEFQSDYDEQALSAAIRWAF
ncbi:outer membrane autotransporter barrel domain [Parvibaculum lavamentivorans DS-1]|uniref:Outer membrane autotransporter barrel domain n=1 Tax=Parvibaculum lavamentivorans (strain DS-1 / DSM 13023 / NCIMB 13966) TaxID=402881 RepID=A7HT97_PARL1|nr:autotransporter outer membrane beta-barrel domain-containing protein [Parvibaculum lavamentivorans]ABS63130.1 outer membrane autotransporter barrel domain [Parvibaculum lavamentivorans DS-1]